MLDDLLYRLFPEVNHATRFLALMALTGIAIGVWFGRKRLMVTIPIAFIVLFVVATAVPSMVSSRPYSERNACVSNMKSIQDAKERWALGHGLPESAIPADSDLFGDNRYFRVKPQCPSGAAYNIGKVGDLVACTSRIPRHQLTRANKKISGP